jgi:hypothetical protein
MCLLAVPRPKLRSPSAMPTRRRSSLSACLPAKRLRVLQTALESLDITCDCKPSLIVSCAIGLEPGCRERRACGTCPCKPRWLPVCLLDQAHGCALCREGKTCKCDEMWMPRCLLPGCPDRQKGRRCECPRTPIELCPHVMGKLASRFGGLTPSAAHRFADAWATQLWKLLPHKYGERPLAAAGCTVRLGESAVALMDLRHKLGCSLWHPDDKRMASIETMRRQAAGLRRLLAPADGKKGGVA